MNGEEVMVALPLEQFVVTDEGLLEILNSMLPPTGDVSLLSSPPTNYVDIANGSTTTASSKYTQYMNFSTNGIIHTSYLKVNMQHEYIRLKSTNIVRSGLASSDKINFTLYMYDQAAAKWESFSRSGVLCTGTNGEKTRVPKGVYPYIYFSVNPYVSMNSMTAEVWTSPL